MTPLIHVDGVSKRYQLGDSAAGLKQAAAAWLTGGNSRQWVWALRDVDLRIDSGETVGMIGHNGAGKSTLLRLIAGVSKPTSGKIETRGRIAAIIALGAGCHPDLTGRENIFLNGTILGLTRAEIRRRFDEIVAFSELEEFIDSPLKHYSSGMSLRLNFAVAAHLRCDILAVDEVLAVGDEQFAAKCRERMRRLRDDGTTIVLVTHNLPAVVNFCSRAVLFRQGRIEADGKPEEIVRLYQEKFATPGALARNDRGEALQSRAHRAQPSAAAGNSPVRSVVREFLGKRAGWGKRP
jgi:ABC-type polysaccharide/polyol phosphate transport system ATPase subunit